MAASASIEKDLMPVLLVDDSMADAALIAHAFKKEAVPNPLLHLKDGQALLHYVHDYLGEYSTGLKNMFPAIVILDLNMPGISGHEVLSKLKAMLGIKRIPIIIMTTSDDRNDIETCFEAGANAYILKPSGAKELSHIVNTLKSQWLNGTSFLPIGSKRYL